MKCFLRYGRSPNYCGNQLTKIFANHPKMKACPSLLYRTLNGSCNNEHHPSWGSAFSAYSRLLPPAYKDGMLFFPEWSINLLSVVVPFIEHEFIISSYYFECSPIFLGNKGYPPLQQGQLFCR